MHLISIDPEKQKNNRKDGFKIVDNYGVSSSICQGSSPNAKNNCGIIPLSCFIFKILLSNDYFSKILLFL